MMFQRLGTLCVLVFGVNFVTLQKMTFHKDQPKKNFKVYDREEGHVAHNM